MITLTPQQQTAFNLIKKFIEDKNLQVFILKGYAGTGKTTLLSFIVKHLITQNRFFKLMAPTGRAAKVISEKTKHEALTIHRSIYTLSKVEEVIVNDEIQDVKYYFPIKTEDRIPLCITDESSMIGTTKNNNVSLHFGSGSLLNDLIEFSKLESGGKIIFVGDPAQLPPVGDTDSNALNEEYFRNKGINAITFELTEILRQKSESLILKNSICVRNALTNPLCRTLLFDTKEGEVENVQNLTSIVKENAEQIKNGQSIIITYTNKDALSYNTLIRSVLFKESNNSINVGDRLIFVTNNYSSSTVLLNGDFAIVTFVSNKIEKQSALVYTKRGDPNSRRNISLFFRDISLKLTSGEIIDCKIIDSLLNSTEPNLTYQEQTALYINFLMRNKDLSEIKNKKLREEECRRRYMTDPYVNAARVKYGYAITGHKSQGGEWHTVYADFYNRMLLTTDCLRWIYTVITRPSHRLIGASLPFIEKTSTLKIEEIKQLGKNSTDLMNNIIAPRETPYHDNTKLASIRAKYAAIEKGFEQTPYSIIKVESRPYLEMYHINTPNGNVRIDGRYDRSGFVSFNGTANPELIKILNDNSKFEFNLNYEPSRYNFKLMYNKIQSAAIDLGLTIANISEQITNYKIIYNLLSDISIIKLEFFFDSNGMFTYAAPFSSLGKEDKKLQELLTQIQ